MVTAALGPQDVGTIDAFGAVLAGLLTEAPDAVEAVGRLPYAVDGTGPGRKLDTYVEAQVHGDIDLGRDAEALVADPSFRGTGTGRLLAATARRCGIALEWHAGFVLASDEVDAEFLGATDPADGGVAAAWAWQFRPEDDVRAWLTALAVFGRGASLHACRGTRPDNGG
ncbi:DUF3626 domain-containing protein [Streptomyces niveus]|uniref:DUF3626 domain-containing protein n=1 Tax=Streptomyces niveus TaxID=193462 RepID=UPI0003C59168|nr:DUF3626 domain-containing protein [Streptomyces niveus]EST29434.1 hypothetical protein M877_12165 [Streptomyces niveus NCIMB 11891]